MAYDKSSQKKHFWLFMILLTVAVILIPIGLDSLGNALASNPEHTYIYESLGMLSVIFICVIALIVFYVINTVSTYKTRKALPKDFWSAWGITKKVLALICVIACIVVFIVTLCNVVSDVNDEPVYKTVVLSDLPSGIDNKAMGVQYYEESDTEKTNPLYRSTMYVKSGIKLYSGKTYKVQIFERSNFWIVVEMIQAQ